MTTVYDEGAAHAVKGLSEEHLLWVNKYHMLMMSGHFKKDYIDLFMQKHWRDGSYSITDAYVFSTLHQMMFSGQIIIVKIGLGHEPLGNGSVEINNKRLLGLPSPFKASFIPDAGRNAEDDGVLSWKEPIRGSLMNLEGKETIVTVRPMSVPLEVGTTSGPRTLVHMRLTGLARWPYGHTDVTVLVASKEATRSQPEARSASGTRRR